MAEWIDRRYTSDDYHSKNPTWDSEDSPWKAAQVQRLLSRQNLRPQTVAEVGCGAGGVLASLRASLPQSELYGFDIAPALPRFWEAHREHRIHFQLGDFLAIDGGKYDLVLVLDVLEHLANPFDFLARLRGRGEYFVFHFPLDLSSSSVARERPLLYVREKVGHLHFFTKGLALAMLAESGYRVIDWAYTGAAFNAPQRTLKTRVASGLRRVAYWVNRDLGVRMLGGETLIVLAAPAEGSC